MSAVTPFNLAALPLALLGTFAYAAEEGTAENTVDLGTVYVTAERQLQQSLGVSKIRSGDIDKAQVTNGISELVRTMPGVNLTNNSPSATRGNKRQIDIRGMGPENTLILIDGKPVSSRQAERMTHDGERNTRGDSNWVPAEAIDSIEVLRGPAAARYGSGAMGGVVNIITKKTTNEFKGSVDLYTNIPQDSDEGQTRRIGFNLSGPIIKDVLSYRIYGSANKTESDESGINGESSGEGTNTGVEGVRNKDIAGRLHWKISPAQSLTLDGSFSRQGSIYNGETRYGKGQTATTITNALIGKESSRIYRSGLSLTHDGAWDWGDSKTYLQYERTNNSRFLEGLDNSATAGDYVDYADSVLKTYRLSHESYIPFATGRLDHVLTAGAEAVHTKLDDTSAARGTVYTSRSGTVAGADPTSGKTSQSDYALYLEDNIGLDSAGRLKLIPSLRFDYGSKFGGNLSPALNFSYRIAPKWTLKGGLARAYKAPNLYQSNSNYLLYSTGENCNGTGMCYLRGNSDLKPEHSLNSELGVEWRSHGYQASLAYFHNDYRNKISSGQTVIGTTTGGYAIFVWENIDKAVTEGFEGNLAIPLGRRLKWNNNFTYMRRFVNKTTGESLSLIPKYTINSTLAWTPTERFDANLTYTYYGKQSASLSYSEQETATEAERTPVPRYGLLGLNLGYKWGRHLETRLGASNLLNKKILRTNNGAQVYNQHGRAFYGSLKVLF